MQTQTKIISNSSERWPLLDSFDPRVATWIVSDIQSKKWLQDQLFQDHEFLEENSILRASDFWNKILFQTLPDVRVVRPEVLRAKIAVWLNDLSEIPWAQKPQGPDFVISQLDLFLPMLASPESHENYLEWLRGRENPPTWGPWSLLALEAWRWIQNEKVILSQWVQGLLITQEQIFNWPRDIILDLGCDLSPLEGELFSRQKVSLVIRPKGLDRLPYSSLERTYNRFSSMEGSNENSKAQDSFVENLSSETQSLEPRLTDQFRVFRFSSPVSEVKWLMGEVRSLLDSGRLPHEIAVLVPDLEKYWPLLKAYLKAEGVPVQKDQVSRQGTALFLNRWVERLYLAAGELKSDRLEASLYQAQKEPAFSLSRFQKSFENLYSEKDLKKEPELEKWYLSLPQREPLELLSQKDFLDWAIELLTPEEFELSQALFQLLLSETAIDDQLTLEVWIGLLRSAALSLEKVEEKGDPGGLILTSLQAADHLRCKNLFFLGLSEQSLRTERNWGPSDLEVESLGRDLGFYLEARQQASKEWRVWWISQSPEPLFSLSFPETDFDGSHLSPSRLWLEMAEQQGLRNVSRQELSRNYWEQEQKNVFKESKIRDFVLQDGDESLRPPLLPRNDLHFSASQIEKIYQCPFRFAGDKLFGLRDERAEDVDLNPLEKGQRIHKLLEFCIREPFSEKLALSRLEEQMIQMAQTTEGSRESFKVHRFELSQLENKVREVIRAEVAWRAGHPRTKIIGTETYFEIFWSSKLNQFVAESERGPEDSKLIGVIDRIDEIGDLGVVVIDYKSSGAGLSSISSWQKNGKFQLFLYAKAMELGGAALGAKDVRGAFFYNLKDLERKKGFGLEGTETDLEVSAKSRNLVSIEKKEETFETLQNEVNQLILKALKGELQPMPLNRDDCQSCAWRGQCRAKHLL